MAVHQKQKPSALYGSDIAPTIYFDGVAAIGVVNGVIQLELAVNHLVPDAEGGDVRIKVACAAHLRAGVSAIRQLLDMVDKAIGLADDGGEKPKSN